ncbi:MAG: arginase family protein [Clostridia bacterium]
MSIAIITQPYNESGKYVSGGAGPKKLLDANLAELLEQDGFNIENIINIEMSKEDENRYGEWLRVATANSYLAKESSKLLKEDKFILGLFANCNSVIGLLGGMQINLKNINHPQRVGLVWIDAHGDYNTPETSPSGMLGGMPVAISAGKCLTNIRETSGLKYPLGSPDIIMLGLRDLDEKEEEMIKRDNIQTFSEKEIIEFNKNLDEAIRYLQSREDRIYVHVDLDILNPKLAPAAGLPTKGGLSGRQLGKLLAKLLSYEKVCGLALVSYKPDRENEEETTKDEIIEAIRLGLKGLNNRR